VLAFGVPVADCQALAGNGSTVATAMSLLGVMRLSSCSSRNVVDRRVPCSFRVGRWRKMSDNITKLLAD